MGYVQYVLYDIKCRDGGLRIIMSYFGIELLVVIQRTCFCSATNPLVLFVIPCIIGYIKGHI